MKGNNITWPPRVLGSVWSQAVCSPLFRVSKTGLHTYSGVSSEARLSVRHAGITLGPPEIRRGPVVVPRVQAALEAAVRAEAVQGASHPLRAQGLSLHMHVQRCEGQMAPVRSQKCETLRSQPLLSECHVTNEVPLAAPLPLATPACITFPFLLWHPF